jgi:dienelactone hydrolase
MAEVVLFHHSLGLTDGVRAFAHELRGAGHTVYTPDLVEGKTFPDVDAGGAYAQEVGFGTILERGRAAVEVLPQGLVYAGFSLGALPAQSLAQTRPGARGALLFHAATPLSEFGGTWPPGVPLQIHIMESDPMAQEGDLNAAREIAGSVEEAELFLYPGDGHLFADPGSPDYDEGAATLLKQRVLGFLDRIE